MEERRISESENLFYYGTLSRVTDTQYPAQSDKALNAVSTSHGSQLNDKKIKPIQLSQLIRNEVCE